ncbi:MAG: hypothetical protein IKV81_04745 [Clostridia bacterium]|nr:hypothetical protein [Clostridia bacterium]
MKKIIAILLTAILLFGVCSVSVFASEADDIKACKNKTDYADYFFGGYNVDYVVYYVSMMFVNQEDELFDNNTMTSPFNGDTINMFLNENFILSEDMLSLVKNGLGYDATTNIYHIPFIGGFGGMNKPREYVSYVKNSNNTYSLYYQTIDWIELSQAGYDKINAMEDYPSKFEFEGKTYESTSEGYFCKNGYKNDGLVHTLEVKNNIARFISTGKYTGSKVPVTPKPDNKEEPKKEETKKEETNNNTSSEAEKPVETAPQTVTKTEGLVLEAVKNIFDKDTVVKAEKVKETAQTYKTVTTSLKEVATKFVAYEITATKKNTTVQPNGTVTATFDIPTDFDTAKVTVYYVSKDGQYEELKTTVDAATRKVTATLKHFSTYVVAEKTAEAVNDNIDNTPTNNDEKDPISPWVIAIIIVGALAVIAVAVVLVLKFKKK